MSVKCMAAVWDHATAKGGERLLLLAIADYARDDGGGAWPSLQRLADKTLFSERNVRYLLRKLEESGELAIHQGAGPHGANRYTITLVNWRPQPETDTEGGKDCPRGAKIAPAKIAPGGQNPSQGGAKIAGEGGKIRRGGGQRVAPDPLLNHQVIHQDDPPESRARAPRAPRPPRPTLESYRPADELVAALAAERPDLGLALVIENWRDYHRERGTAIKDFDASLRRWVRGEKPPPLTARPASRDGKLPGPEAAEAARRILNNSPPQAEPTAAIEATFTTYTRRGPR